MNLVSLFLYCFAEKKYSYKATNLLPAGRDTKGHSSHRAIEQAETGDEIISMTMEDFVAYTPKKRDLPQN